VVETVKPLGISLAFSTDLCPAMSAGVKKKTNIVITIPREDNGATADIPGLKIARSRYFRFMTRIYPALVKYPLAFGYQNYRVNQSFAVKLEVIAARVIYYVWVFTHWDRMPDLRCFVYSNGATPQSVFRKWGDFEAVI
jgi:hypothetical protein